MARILIVGGGCRALGLARELVADGHAVRITTRTDARQGEIEATGAECWVGTPDRLATLRAALQNVTVVCWLLATATGTPAEVRALHSSRLEFFLGQIIDTTVRGFVYEAPAKARSSEMASSVELVRSITALNSIPLRLVEADPVDSDVWLLDARVAIDSIFA